MLHVGCSGACSCHTLRFVFLLVLLMMLSFCCFSLPSSVFHLLVRVVFLLLRLCSFLFVYPDFIFPPLFVFVPIIIISSSSSIITIIIIMTFSEVDFLRHKVMQLEGVIAERDQGLSKMEKKKNNKSKNKNKNNNHPRTHIMSSLLLMLMLQ